MYEQILKERQRLSQQLNSLREKLQEYPKGKLICCHDGTQRKWYQSDGHTKTYIPKAKRKLAEQLAAKKYLSALSEGIAHEIRTLDFYLDHHRPATQRADYLLTEVPGYKELLSPYFKSLSQEISEWMNAPYERNPKYPEQLTHTTASGNPVRSKSEAMIDMFLYTNQIPFRYECALTLDNMTIYPDFTIRHPRTGEIFYWEHFGLMDDPSYRKSTFSKLQLYSSQGIIPSIQLITTYETADHPLTTEVIQKIIEHYFL